MPYSPGAFVRSILNRKVGFRRRHRLRPMLSGPTEKKYAARTPWRSMVRRSEGTPLRVPRKVSTSTRMAIFILVSLWIQETVIIS